VIVGLARKVVPSVVNISTTAVVKSPGYRGGPEDFFRKFFEEFFRRQGRGFPEPDSGGDGGSGGGAEGEESGGGGTNRGGRGGTDPRQGRLPRSSALGTGFVIDRSGLILTNNHVVADAEEIKIFFTEEDGEKPTDGEVVGRDPELDLALIRVKTSRQLVPLALGDSEALSVGEYVMAVGNPFGQGHSVTHGIVSAKGRRAPDFQLARYIQSDAPINPGNSGGPLVNLKGEVIGINNAIDQRAQGIGFAIPINLVKEVLEQLKTKGVVDRGYIGVLINELTPELAEKLSLGGDASGALVAHVYPGEPADKAGIRPYDLITEIGGKKVANGSELVGVVTSVPVGSVVEVKLRRGRQRLGVKVLVAQRPGSPQAGTGPGAEKSPKEEIVPPVETGLELSELTPEFAQDLGLKPDQKGVVVQRVEFGSAADRAGLFQGDFIQEVEGKPVTSRKEFYAVVKERKKYLLRVRRLDPQGGEFFDLVILDLLPR
jgi:serine protease Do